jgi:hypothetical protein
MPFCVIRYSCELNHRENCKSWVTKRVEVRFCTTENYKRSFQFFKIFYHLPTMADYGNFMKTKSRKHKF